MGLVKQVVSGLARRNIQRLTQTYMTLSLTDIAQLVGLASAQEAELQVIR
jgi:COP9 signalosome complex subunit 3